MSAVPPPPANGQRSRFNLSAWALEHQPLIRYLMVVLLAAGVLSFFGLGQDEDPPFPFRAMVIRAYWPGASAQQMAEQVADRIERKLQEVPYADKIRSYSKPGETAITPGPPADVTMASLGPAGNLFESRTWGRIEQLRDFAHPYDACPPEGCFINRIITCHSAGVGMGRPCTLRE